MSPPDTIVKIAKILRSCAYYDFLAEELTNTEHERYVANTTLRSRYIVDGLEIYWKVVEQGEERPSKACYSISDALLGTGHVCLQEYVKAVDKDLPSPKECSLQNCSVTHIPFDSSEDYQK